MNEKQHEVSELPLGTSEIATYKPLAWPQLLLKTTGLALVFVLLFLLITALGIGVIAYSKFSQFLSSSNLNFTEFKTMIEEGVSTDPLTTNNRTTLLVLGVDTVANKNTAPPLTDTMLLISIDYATAKINLLSLPRDLWSEAYKTKINALYYYGQERYPEEPQRFPAEVVTELTGVPINYTIVFSLDSIGEIVTILDGLDVDVPKGFVDTEFPREDVTVEKVTDSALLYETVEFKTGTEHMDDNRVKKFIRSRHSEGDTGTDIDRSARQQLVVSSLVKKLISRDVLTNPTTMAKLYSWYQERLAPFIDITDAIGIAYALYPSRQELMLKPNVLPIKTSTSEGIIEHLPVEKTDNQWTYSIVDKEGFKTSVNEILF